jgi:lysophospholipase L1-like esterase
MMRLKFAVFAFCALACSGAAIAEPAETWLGGWAHVPTSYNLTPVPASPQGSAPRGRPGFAPLAPYNDVTVRELVRISAGATRLRFRFSNEFGATAMTLGSAHVALVGGDGAIISGSDHALRFAGRERVVIPPGAPVLSDPLDWKLPAFAKLMVSVYYPQETLPPAHTLFALPAEVSPVGNFSEAAVLPGAIPARNGNALSEIDIVSLTPSRTVVAFGDSITEGVASTVGAFRGWPDRLSERLQENRATRDWSVVNAGIGSNRLLHDTPGANALARFDRDVLSVPGVATVIVLEGINDIQYSHRYPTETVTADDMIAGLRQLCIRAHTKGVRILAGTITAFEGSPDYTEQGEAMRQAVNDWIRTTPELDGVIDFDAATRDPTHPTRLRAETQTRDHLHPGDAGYAAMGDAIDLTLISGTAARK